MTDQAAASCDILACALFTNHPAHRGSHVDLPYSRVNNLLKVLMRALNFQARVL
jgi:hypothetical protein